MRILLFIHLPPNYKFSLARMNVFLQHDFIYYLVVHLCEHYLYYNLSLDPLNNIRIINFPYRSNRVSFSRRLAYLPPFGTGSNVYGRYIMK